MNPREKIIASVLGGVVGLWVLYQGVDKLVLGPVRTAEQDIVRLTREAQQLQRERDSVQSLGKRWSELARRTYAFDERSIQNHFGDELKQVATAHHLSSGQFTPRSASRLGQTDVKLMGFQISATGKLSDVVGALRDFYHLPVLGRVRKLSLSPVKQTGGSDEIRITEMLVETPMLSTFEAVDVVKRALRNVTTMPSAPAERPKPQRTNVPEDSVLALFNKRNIFKAYEPPTPFAVTVDNQDLLAVEVAAHFSWKGEKGEQPNATVLGKSKKELPSGAGDVVELTAKYADGKTFGPQRLENRGNKAVVFSVPSHTPPPPPKTFVYRVRNDANEVAEVNVSVVKGGSTKQLPAMRVPSRQTIDLPELEAERMTIAGKYADGTSVPQEMYQVAQSPTGTYVIPAKGAAPKAPPPPVAKADPDQEVTALLTYPGKEEMVSYNTKTRKRQAISQGDGVDGGKLIAVHPLGGVVEMPGGVFYLYPLGRRFVDRVELNAHEKNELAAAIAGWNE